MNKGSWTFIFALGTVNYKLGPESRGYLEIREGNILSPPIILCPHWEFFTQLSTEPKILGSGSEGERPRNVKWLLVTTLGRLVYSFTVSTLTLSRVQSPRPALPPVHSAES